MPYGYNYDAAAQGLAPNLAEAAILRRIYEQAARLISLTDIANTLNAEGIRTRARIFQRRDGTKQSIGEKRFRTDILRRLIMRRLYAGRVRMHGTEYPGQHDAIVSHDFWERANAAVRRSLQPARCRLRARDKHFHVLKGIAVCGCCSRAMIPNASGKRDPSGQLYRYYTCGYAHKESAGRGSRLGFDRFPSLPHVVTPDRDGEQFADSADHFIFCEAVEAMRIEKSHAGSLHLDPVVT